MKKCPICERTFDDSMKFCQTDGTPLVAITENAAPDDVYKTTVGRQEDIAAAPIQPDPFKTMIGGSFGKDESNDLLQIPADSDPLKTMYTTDEEMKREMASHKPANEGIVEIAPLADDLPSETAQRANDSSLPTPAPPRFDEPNLSPPSFGESQSTPSTNYSSTDYSAGNAPKEADSFGEIPAPNIPSPFEDKTAIIDSKNPFDSKPYTSPNSAIPSPFNESRPTSYDPPSTPLPTYKESEPFASESQSNPFNQPMYAQPLEQNQPLQPVEWTPPPAPEANWQNQSIGANTPFQPPVATSGQNQTLPIVSLVLGILSLCCYVSPLTGIAALITGYLGMKNANNDPVNYGGKTMAIIGMVLGGLFLVIGIIYWILILVVGVAGLIPQQ